MLAAIIVIIILALQQSNGSGAGSKGDGEATTGPPNEPASSTLGTVKNRGNLTCGVVEYAGLSAQDSSGTWSGFEVDLVSES